METEVKWTNITPNAVLGLEKILDYLIENDTYVAKIGNIEIIVSGTKVDTVKGKRQVFEIQRKLNT